MSQINFDPEKLKTVPIEDVRANTWNPKEKDHKKLDDVVRSIEMYGFRLPVRVRQNEGYEIIDGEQRYQAAKRIGMKEILIYDEGEISDEDAKNDTLWWQVQVPFDDIPLAGLVTELADLNLELPYSADEIANFKELAGFSFEDYNEDRPNEDNEDPHTLKIKLSAEQFKIVNEALDRIKKEADCEDARALELLAADYIAGSEPKEEP